ncbi:MAG TPA: filamentous hemagglutinin N-terminal domain-containing protein [Verrucomicrobiae bacterium]|nr:filamentous hemagglutinin N-terminal domain-containing protein [Verrucomicrobiae bacterium]
MHGMHLRYSLFLIGVCWQLTGCPPCPAQPTGHVVLDGSLGSSGPLSGPDYNITANLGKTVGNNLFQSFSQFDLVNGEVATFSGPVNIQNILARITGGNPSSIDGTIQSTIPGANLFFLNPFGVLFGSHARVNISGSFAVTSASYIKLADGGRFDAANPANDVLTAAPVSAFGFLGSTPGNITFQQSSLAVPAGQSFSVIGGGITLSGATIQAPGGRVNLVSINSPGELALDITDLNALPDATAFGGLGPIVVQDFNSVQSTVDTSGPGGGLVVIRGGSLMVQNSVVEANTLGGNDGKGIDVNVTGDLSVDGGQITTDTSGAGKGGAITITASSVNLNAEGNSVSGILSDSESTGSGDGGNVSVTAPTVNILNGARISAATDGLGNGGNVTVNTDSIDMDAMSAQGFSSAATGIFVSSLNDPGGNAGRIVIRPLSSSLSLQIVNGAQIAAETDGSGLGGSINIAADSIALDGETSSQFTGIDAMTFGSGNGGNIQIQTRVLTLANGSQLSATTFGSGAGGDISANADTISIRTSSSINSQTFGLGPGGNIDLTATTSITADGLQANGSPGFAEIAASNPFGVEGNAAAGNVTISTPLLAVLNGADVSTSVLGASPGGDIAISASTVKVLNGGQISAATDGTGKGGDLTIAANTIDIDGQGAQVPTGISVASQLVDPASGGAGSIVVRPLSGALSLQVVRGGAISASTSGGGAGGGIDITADSIELDGQSSPLVTGILATTSGGGPGGDIQIQTRALTLANAAQLSAATSGGGAGGDIAVTADTISLATASRINAQTTGLGPGGNINLSATTSLILNGQQFAGVPGLAEIGAGNPSGAGSSPAGSIAITTPLLELLNGADISASVVGGSTGGNITIHAGALALNDHGAITCSSQNGLAGSIAITTDQILQLQNASVISVSSANNNAGNVSVVSGGSIRLADSQITAQAAQDGGDITLTALSVNLQNSSVDASAGSHGGNVTVDPQSVVLNNSTIASSAGTGTGGNIILEPAGSVYLFDSTLTARSTSGNGGDILVAGPAGNTGTGAAGAPLVTLNQSAVVANAPKGHGGDITFVAKGFLQSGGLIDASGAENGTVEIRSPDVDLTGVVVPLPASLLDAESQLQPYCGVKFAGVVSSFLVVGKGGVPLQPFGVSPSLGLPPVNEGVR